MKGDEVKTARFVKALLGFALVSIGVFASLGYASADEEASGTYVAQIWDDVTHGKAVSEALEQVGFTSVDTSSAPAWLGEVCDLSAFEEAIANADYSLVNLSYQGGLSSAWQCISGALGERGWVEVEGGLSEAEGGLSESESVWAKAEGEATEAEGEISEAESGCEGMSTFIKEEGECRWVMVECVEVEDVTSVVLHIKHT